MISFNFDYYKPDSIDEAVEAFRYLDSIGKHPLYYNGGTEIITFARVNSIYTGGVIDIKEIPECNVLDLNQDYLILGSSVTLSQISDSYYYPLLGRVSREIGDRTVRNKITIGGNICGKIQFREAVLPLLISDCFVVTAGGRGIKTYPLDNVFNGKLKLEPDEFLVQIIISAEYMRLPCINIKRRRQSTVGYPLISIAAIKKDEQIRFAISGLSDSPFRSLEMEEEINKYNFPVEIRVENAIESITYPIKDNLFGSAEYRKLLLRNALIEIIGTLEVKNEVI
jgi:CO/xanthine dehydrogenase FAD-binding subunit